MNTLLTISLFSLLVLPAISSANPITVNVWPKFAPGETTTDVGHESADQQRLTDVTMPQLRIYPIEGKSNRPALLIFPGGAYEFLSLKLEGTEIAEWLNKEGYVAAILTYRVPNLPDGALQDAQRAMSYMRSNAKQYGIDPKRIGVIGFSAGGNLAVWLACENAKRAYIPVDKVDEVSCKPNFILPIYPGGLIERDTQMPTPILMPNSKMPPVFMMQTLDDPYLCAPKYSKLLEAAKVNTKLVTYENGGHGYGLRLKDDQPAYKWKHEALKWIKEQVGVK